MIDCSDLIGVPYELGGRGPDSYDCWGLCVEVARRGGLVLPDEPTPVDIEVANGRCVYHIKNHFMRLDVPEPFAIVGMDLLGNYHAGIVLDNCVQFIHVTEGINVTAPSLSHPSWQNFIVGFYRYVGSTGNIHTQPV